jgi:hypothetical protein
LHCGWRLSGVELEGWLLAVSSIRKVEDQTKVGKAHCSPCFILHIKVIQLRNANVEQLPLAQQCQSSVFRL